jgi:hypothetical protein
MGPIFSKDGAVTGWLLPSGGITDADGNYRAFLAGDNIFDYHGHFLGSLHEGYILDRDGKAVAFVPGAKGDPPLPRTDTLPPPPVIGHEPDRPSKPLVPRRIPAYSKRWSELNWDDFLGGRHLFIAYRR